jgi:uncharacterized protein (DUF885 family)
MRRSIVVALIAGAGCATTQNKSVDLNALVAEYVEGSLEENPGLGRGVGLHEYDGRIAEIGDAAAAKAVARAKAYLEATKGVDLSQVQDPLRLDLQLTRLDAESTIFWTEMMASHERVLRYNGLFDVNSYLVRDYAPLEQRVAKLLDHAEAATQATDALLATLDEKQVRTHLETAAQVVKGMVVFYQNDVAVQTKPALDASPELKARYEKVIPAAIAAIQKIGKWIDDHMAQATEDYAIGEERFLTMLRANEGLEITLEELEEMAMQDFQRNHDAWMKLSEKIDPVQVMSSRLPADRVLETARTQATDLRRFIEEKQIISIPSQTECKVKETPPFMRWNSAFLDGAGPFEKTEDSFYYISPPDPTWPPEMQAQYIPWEGDLLGTTIHEVYPGHYLHGLFIRRAPSKAAKVYGSYAFTEGWAHYTEEMILDAGYAEGDPALKLGQLSNALLRNCRFIAAIGLHTKGMTVEQAEELFKKQCFIDPGNARQQAYRGTFDPGYLSYTLGKIQILKLREKFFAKRGTDDLKAFHDWLMSFGSAPVALVEQRL